MRLLKDAGVASLDEAHDEGSVAFLIDGKTLPWQRREVLKQAQELRDQGRNVAVLPMRKNMKRQIATLEGEGFTEFNKVYAD